jgi:hypothetical protein
VPVDPLHLSFYWDIGENTARITPDGGFDNDLTLRIYWRPDESPEIKCSNVWFDLSADNPECRQKVRLPIDDTAYSATLGKLNPDNSIDPLAHSNIIHVPPAPGRIMKTQVLNNLNNNLPVSDFPNAFKTSEQDSLDASKFNYEEPPIVKDIQVSLYEKLNEGPHFPEHGWFVKLHFNDSFAYNGDTPRINAEFMAFLNKKGINVELIPERPFIEYSTYQGKNASGQGM